MKAGDPRRGLLFIVFLLVECAAFSIRGSPACFPLAAITLLTWLWADGKLQSAGDPFIAPPSDEEGKFWLQHTSSSVDIIKDETFDGIMAAFKSFDWKTESEAWIRSKGKAVPPGLGLGTFGDEEFVHLTAMSEDKLQVLYVVTVPGKKKPKQSLKNDVPFADAAKIVKAYLDNDRATLDSMLAE